MKIKHNECVLMLCNGRAQEQWKKLHYIILSRISFNFSYFIKFFLNFIDFSSLPHLLRVYDEDGGKLFHFFSHFSSQETLLAHPTNNLKAERRSFDRFHNFVYFFLICVLGVCQMEKLNIKNQDYNWVYCFPFNAAFLNFQQNKSVNGSKFPRNLFFLPSA